MRFAFTGMIYYLNCHTKKSQWDRPDGPAPLEDEEDDDDDGSSPTEVQCSHILVKHAESRRPSSWKEANITRSKGDAFDIIHGTCRVRSIREFHFIAAASPLSARDLQGPNGVVPLHYSTAKRLHASTILPVWRAMLAA